MGIEDGEIVEALADMLDREGARFADALDMRGNPLYVSRQHMGDTPIHVLLLESLGRRVHRELARRRPPA